MFDSGKYLPVREYAHRGARAALSMLGLGPLRLGQMSLASGILTNKKASGG